jgi:hypothetical protein
VPTNYSAALNKPDDALRYSFKRLATAAIGTISANNATDTGPGGRTSSAPGWRRVSNRNHQLSTPRFALQFPEQHLRAHQLITKNPPCYFEQVTHEGIAHRIANREACFLRRHDAMVPEHGELLRDDRLLECQGALKLLHRAPAAHKQFKDANAGGVCERPKILCLERLEFAGG